MKGKCALCGGSADLRHSHIVPEFLYGLTYDEKHRFVLVPGSTDSRPRYQQQGLREYLLCQSCEVRFSRFERHAKQVMLDTETFHRVDERKRLIIHGVKYPEFKLFWMSVLWRMGLSSLDLFSPVELGPHAEALRQRLEAEDPDDPLLYPTMFLAPLQVPKLILRSMAPPEPFRMLGFRGYRWFVGGLIIVFLVDQRRVNEQAKEAVLNQQGELPILKDVDGSSAPLMRQMIEKMWRLAQVHKEGV
jgi:hypothetical protein